MKQALLALTIAAFLTAPKIARALTIDPLIDEWMAKRYDSVLPQLLVYREGAQGRNWKIDYMIGTSWCHGAQHSKRGIPYLSNVLQYKDAPSTARSFVEREISYCHSAAVAPSAAGEQPSFDLVPVSGQVIDPAGVYGKGGYNWMSAQKPITASAPKPTPISLSELHHRVYLPNQSELAVRAATARLGQNSAAIAANGFVVVCSQFCTPPVEATVATCLARYQAPLAAEFDIVPPTELITVYIPADIAEVPAYARKLHGVDLPLGILAYSVVDDLSIVGLYTQNGCGSLAHELVHLSIKGNFGDSPAWLEEGLASEIAVSAPQKDGFHFAPNWDNWRNDMLRAQWSLRPSVNELLSMTWAAFATNDPAQLNRVAATHAMAAVFIQYLDAKGKLRGVYVRLRDRRFDEAGEGRPTSADIIQESLGKGLSSIDADFASWFQAVPPTHADNKEQR